MAINAKNYDPALMAGANLDISVADVTIDDLSCDTITATGTSALAGITGSSVSVTGLATTKNATAVPATAGAVAAGPGISMFSSNISIWVTSDTPTHSATKGDLCLNTGGSSTSTRLFINNGTTNWVAITTAS